MKKLITLLALCCLMVTGAWADVQKLHLTFPSITSTGATVSVTDQSGTAVAGVSASVSQAVQNGTTNKNFFTTGAGYNDKVLGVQYGNAQNDYWEVTFTITGLSSFNGREIPSIDVCTPLLTSAGAYQGGTTVRTWDRTLTINDSQYGETLSGAICNNNNEVSNQFVDASATISGGQLVLKVKMKKTDAQGCFAGVKYIDINMPTTPTTQTYTVNITGATGATVTFGSNTYANGQTFSAENPTASQFTASEVPGFYPSISIGSNTINVTYNLLPFTTGRTYNLTLKGNIVYYDEATGNFKAGNVEDSENTSFIIGGTYADGYTLKSVGADEYLKHENVNNDNAKATTTANESEATRYEYAVKDGYHYFKIRGTANNYVNYRDGYFSSWNNGSALGNDGSRLTFSEPVDPDKGYHIFQNNGTLNTTGTSEYCSQWTSSHINPQISINVTDGNGAANDMERSSTYANNGIVCYTGNNRDSQGYKATLTVAASYGYKITGFEFDASKADVSDYTIDVTAGGTTKTVSGTTAQHFSQTGVNAQEFVIVIKETATSATHNKPILLNNFYVTYEAAEPVETERVVVFDNANSSVPYRIPAVGQASNGDLIFVSDYRYSHADIGSNTQLDLKYRKKYADGHWGTEQTLAHYIQSPFCAFGDPCIVCDRTSNRVMVTSCCGNIGFPTGTHENHQGWAQWYSTDNGETWSEHHVDISKQVMDQVDQRTGCTLASFFIGSGKISQSHIIKKGQYYRLYCSSNTRINNPSGGISKMNFVWYSDDFGETWTMLGTPDETPIDGGDEPKADELPDGSVVVSSRDSGRIFNIFHYTDYENAKGYWGTQMTSSSNNSGCYGTGCNGEILIVPVMKKSDSSKTYLALQSIPAASDRRNVSIYWKELTDFTKYRNASELAPNWTKFQVSGTTSAYSTMCQLKDGDIAFFYEENSHNDGYDMVYKKFTIEAITEDAYEFYDLNDAAKASEKNAYLSACVGSYFDTQTTDVQALADAYEAAPTMKNYDALNAALQSPDEAFFTPGLYQIQIGTGSGASHTKYNGYYMYAKGSSETWPIGLTTDATNKATYVYIWGSHNNWHMEFNHGKTDSYYAANNCKSATSAANLTFTPNDDQTEWKIWGGNQRWMGWESGGVAFVGSSSTSSTANDNCYFIFTKVEEEDIPTAGKVYTIKAHFTSDSYTDIYLTSDTGAEQLLLPMPTTATANQSYWVAEASGNTDRPWKFKSGYGYAKYLDWQSGTNGLSANGDNFGVLDCSTVLGTYHLNVSTNDRNIGTWGNNNDTKKGFGAVGSGGCWSQNKGHSNATATNYWTTDYEIVSVKGVTAYKVSCENANGGVAPAFANYGGVATVKNGGYIIVPNGTTLNATNFPAAEISGYTGSVTFNGTTITVTYEATVTHEGFHIYESNGTYSNTASSSEYKDKWLSTDTDPQFTILVTGGGRATNNMYHSDTYEDSGILCYTGNNSIGYTSTMTVSVQSGYKITGYTFKVKNLEGETSSHGKVVTTAGQTINTTAANQTVEVSGLHADNFTITLDGSTGTYNEGLVFTDFYVTYEEVELPTSYTYDATVNANGSGVSTFSIANVPYTTGEIGPFDHAIQKSEVTVTPVAGYTYTLNITQPTDNASKGTIVLTYTRDASLEMLETAGTYYVYIKDDGKYLHNIHGSDTQKESTERAQSEIERTNSYIWRLVSDGENVTITNGVGNGYNSATPNTIAIDELPANWHIDQIVESKIWNVEVRYAEEGCIYNGTTPAYNGGFFVTAKGTESITTTAGPVTDLYSGDVHDDRDPDNPTLLLRYYTEEEKEDMPYLQTLIYNALMNMFDENVGYAPFDDEDMYDDDIFELVVAFMMDPEVTGYVHPENYKESLAAFNKLVESKKDDIIMPQAGHAFRLSVRSTNGRTRRYLTNNGTTSTNKADAAVFVMGSTSNTEEGYGTLFASNNNGASKYLQSRGATGAQYAEGSCDFEIKSMVNQSNEKITADLAHRFGTFSLVANGRASGYTNMKGAVLVKESDGGFDNADIPFMNGTLTSAIEMEEVEYPYTEPSLATGTGDGHTGVWASVWLPFPMNIPDGIEVYKGTQERTVDGDPYLGLTKVDPDTHSCYAAGGYLLYSTTVSAGPIDVLPANSVPTDARETDDAAFVGSTENPGVADDGKEWDAFSATFDGKTPYVLANKSNGVGFYKYVGTKMPKGKAIWLKPADSSDAECVKLGFDEIISAIEALHGNTTNAEIYDLQGHRLDKVEKGQINVINGQKIMFK